VELGRLGSAVRIGVRSDEGPSKLQEEADHMVDGTDGVRELLKALLD
jgi:trehalose 6-phosphate phosphatase